MRLDDELFFARPMSRRQLVGLDVAVAVVYTLVVLAVALGRSVVDPAAAVPTPVRLALVLAMGVPLACRRAWPVQAFAVAVVATLAALTLGLVQDGFLGASYVLYAVAVREDRPHRALTMSAAGVAVAGLVMLVVAGSAATAIPDIGTLLVSAVDLTGAWTIGRAVRERRRYAERASVERVARAVADERLRIARDLHDIVAHGLSLMVVKAATAHHVLDTRPDDARDALGTIETTGRAALVEMRRLLDVLRSEGSGGDVELAPAPGVGQLRSLADRVAAAGVPVDLALDTPGELPDGISLAVYRIVQEAMTNVVRHAGQARCRVSVGTRDGSIEVEVADDGIRGSAIGHPAGDPGHGLIGMRERVRMLGGEFTAGPLPGRGYRVAARIPLRVKPPTDAATNPRANP